MSPLLKAQREPLATRPVDWADVRRQAARLVEEARAQALGILEKARAEAEAGTLAAREARAREEEAIRADHESFERRATEEARAAWEARALAEGQALLEPLLQKEVEQMRGVLLSISGALQSLPERLGREAEAQTVRLALEIAALLVRREIRTDPALISGAVRAALEALVVSGPVTLHLNPEDRALVEAGLPRLLEGLSLPGPVTLEADPAIARGGCRATAGGASADATLERQLESLRATLLGGGDA